LVLVGLLTHVVLGQQQEFHDYWYFRLCAPTEASFDRRWPLPDIEKAK
jgi:hypothetical protein